MTSNDSGAQATAGRALAHEEVLVEELSATTISLRRAITFAFVDMQMGPGLAIFAGYLLVTGGGGSWFAILLAGGLILSVTEVVRVFSQRFVVTGGLMTYLVKAGWRRAGLFVGGANLLGYLALSAAVSTGVTYFAQSAFYDLGWEGLLTPTAQVISFVSVSLLLTFTALRGLRFASTVAIGLGFLCVPFVLWVTIQALVMVGPDVQWGVLSPEFGSVALLLAPVTLTLSNYIGFDGWAFLAAETDEPQRNVPRILHTVVLGSLAAFLVVALMQLPLLAGHEDAINAGVSPLSILAESAGLQGVGTLLNVVLGLALFAAGITTLTYGGRLFAAAGAIGMLPRALSRVSSESSSPYVAIVLLGISMAALPTGLALSVGLTPIEAGIYFSEATAYLWALPYVVSALVAGVLLRRSTDRPWYSVGAVITCAAGYAGFLAYSLSDGWVDVYTVLPWICTALTLGVYAVVLVVERSRGGDINASELEKVD